MTSMKNGSYFFGKRSQDIGLVELTNLDKIMEQNFIK